MMLAYSSVSQAVANGPPVVPGGSPGDPLFPKKKHFKNCIRHLTNENYTHTCLY
jgi:hypothetical protein